MNRIVAYSDSDTSACENEELIAKRNLVLNTKEGNGPTTSNARDSTAIVDEEPGLPQNPSEPEPEQEDAEPNMEFTRIHEQIVEMTECFHTLNDMRLNDRQGILLGSARHLGTFSQLRTCPYNESHRVGEGRFHQHLIRCRQANPDKDDEVKICDYNRSHHIPAEVFNIHEQVCPTRCEVTVRNDPILPTCTLRIPREGVRCNVSLIAETDSMASESESLNNGTRNSIPLIEASEVPQTANFKTAIFQGPYMAKPKKYLSWF